MIKRGSGAGGEDRDDPSREVGIADDASRTGFGGRRWSDLPPPRDEAVGGADAGTPFGGPAWRRFEEAAAAEAEDEDAEGGPRRRKPPTPPPYPRKTVAALGAAVRVTRDDAAIPHVSAKSERDAYAALGYCMAEDRLWQMDLVRRLASGRSAELLGPAFAGHDALVRTAGLARRAAAGARRLSGVARDVLAAFTAGVNAVRADARPPECELLGYEIEPWTIADSLAVEVLLAWAASLRVWPAKLLVARAVASSGIERARWLQDAALEHAHVAGDRVTACRQLDLAVLDVVAALPLELLVDGAAVAAAAAGRAATLAATLHLPPTLPAFAYAAHLGAPGVSVAGAALLGTPIFLLGRNPHCAWAASTALVDDADCVLEELDGIGNFRTAAGWAKLGTRREQVRVRGGETMQLEVVETRNGPLVSHFFERIAGRAPDARLPALALRWGPNSAGSSIAGWLAAARARDVGELGAAATLLDRGPCAFVLVGADAQGGVGRWTTGGLPERAGPAMLPVRGWSDEAAWRGVQPLAAGSAALAGGVAAVACGRTGAEAPDGADVARRLQEVARPLADVSVASLRATLDDAADVLARAVLPALSRALASPEAASEPTLARIADALRGWDGSAAAGGAAAPVYAVAMLHFLPQDLFPEARFGPLVRFADVAWRAAARIAVADSSPWYPDAASRDRALVSAVRRAAEWLATACGPDPELWSWARVLDAERRHLLAGHDGFASGAVAGGVAGGAPFAVRRVTLRAGTLPFAARLVPSVRIGADLAADELHLGLAGGASGRPGDAHFADLLQAFGEGRDRVFRLTGDVKGDLTELISG